MSSQASISVPADVPETAREIYIKNLTTITHGTGRLMLFAGDQKIEHLNSDFYGKGIPADDADPEHLFRVAAQGRIGVFATQIGLVARYGPDYPEVPYLVKLNSKTNLVKTAQNDPVSPLLTTVEQVVRFREQSGLTIAGVGYTIYLGSEFEDRMLAEAAEVVNEAHQHGLVTVLWIYPRGSAVKDEKDPHLIAGATGVAACLGSDFVKVNAPKKEGAASADLLKEATLAAGRTSVVCAGGSSVDEEAFLRQLYDQIHTGGARGNATGRNIHQKSFDEAVRMCNAISAITLDDASVEDALALLKGN
ncbi:fructose-bisphosphate aldolase/6-deoxy-5-ketofructose 1-phosphate synthase [Methanofollis sp. W23]|uniref:aldolase n=1 Tax=Methanofollis sp. W23 TaxID=2817849 RepID=UPI001AE7E172|nr:aldolase [Methanofollis sp. W23]MBP2145637.1 fructose-bisphosphate aldolase/6-deoxy-5-ketofructose 1-phosphate synthase [Methanofollis sp. W23]